MKKLILVACLAIVAVALVPIASASAAELTGVCELEGTAVFENVSKPGVGLTKKLEKVHYSFTSEPAGTGTKCTEVPSGKREGTTTVEGTGELQCVVAAGGITVVGQTGAPGKGHLFGAEYAFELSFVAQAGVVDLMARAETSASIEEKEKQPYTATGVAEFLNTEGPTAITNCATKETGIPSLKFKAVTAGTI